MKKQLLPLLAFIFIAQMAWAVDQTYYSTIDSTKGTALRDKLFTITSVGPKDMSYKKLWEAYKTTDIYPADSVGKAGKIWDMYSNYLFTPGDDQCGNYSHIGSCYNREHSLPKSWFGEATPAYYDMGHIVPTDGYVNNQRGNSAFGECKDGTRLTYTKNGTTYYGKGKLGTSTFEGFESVGTVFEPDDEFKGDFARMYMYMAVRYKKGNGSDVKSFVQDDDGEKMFNDTDSLFGLTDYSVALLMKWHRMDPVSRKEIDRNNGMEQVQANRNPFIDYPILAEYLWGTKSEDIFSFRVAMGSFEEDFIPGVSDGAREESQAIENEQIPTMYRKILRDGQLLILSGDKTYTIYGQIVQ